MLSSVDYRARMEADPIDLINRDCVPSAGFIISRSLPVVGANARVFGQALSLDEVCNCTCSTHNLCIAWPIPFSWQHRTRFRPNIYHTMLPGVSLKTSNQYTTNPGTDVFETDVKEVWFSGCHSGELNKTRALAWLTDGCQMFVEAQPQAEQMLFLILHCGG